MGCWNKIRPANTKNIIFILAVLEIIFTLAFFLIFHIIRLVDVNWFLSSGHPKFVAFKDEYEYKRGDLYNLQIYCWSSIVISFVIIGHCGLLLNALRQVQKIQMEFWLGSSILTCFIYFLMLALYYFKIPIYMFIVLAIFIVFKIYQYVMVGFLVDHTRIELTQVRKPKDKIMSLESMFDDLESEPPKPRELVFKTEEPNIKNIDEDILIQFVKSDDFTEELDSIDSSDYGSNTPRISKTPEIEPLPVEYPAHMVGLRNLIEHKKVEVKKSEDSFDREAQSKYKHTDSKIVFDD